MPTFALLALTTLALAQAPPTAEPAAEPSALETGRALLAEKRVAEATKAFDLCLQDEARISPKTTSPTAAECHWERGWARWLGGDWAGVAEDWEAVQKVDPTREGLAGYLRQAQDNIRLKTILAKGRDGAAKTFKSDVPAGTTVRLRAVGDMMIGTTFPAGALNPNAAATFADVTPWLADADVTFGNLEGPLCDGGKTGKCKPDAKPGSCYAFRSPASYRDLFKGAGFDVVSTANNHAGDFGEFCRSETEKNLDAVGIAHTGRPGDIASLTVNGLKIAFIGFHTSRNSHYINDHETAVDLVRAMDSEHDGHLRVFTHTVIDAGADLVLGHGPHVPRAMEVYNDRLIAYSMGNFATYGRFNVRGNQGLGMVVEVLMDADGRFVGGKILPTKQHGEGIPAQDADGGVLDVVRTLSAEDFPATGIQVALDGTMKAR